MPHNRTAVAAGLTVLVLAGLGPDATAAPVKCTGEYQFDLSPGLSLKPSSGSSLSTRPGPFRCSDGRAGTIAFAGRYGTGEPAVCTSGGEGWGVWEIKFVKERPVRDTMTYDFGRLAKGVVTGTFDSDRMTGTLSAVPVRGDCVTTPVTRGHVQIVGTLRG